jgi:WXXGXW repeat (2 copies)
MKKLAVTLAIGAASLLSVGAMVVPTAAQAQAVISVQVGPPPAPRYEHVPPPRPGYLWAPGHYEWNHGRYVWLGGNWMRERPGYAYRPPQWHERGGHWEYHAGGWDNDHDRGPSRYDHRPNNPYRS